MKRLPLYPDDPRLAVELAAPLQRNADCTLCELGGTNKSTCVRSEPVNWEPGGILVVGDAPQREEDGRNSAFVSKERVWVKDIMKRLYGGPVAYTLGVRCMPQRTAKDEHVEACRGYLNHTIKTAKPGKIIALGKTAITSVLGYSVQVSSVSRGYSYVFGDGQDGAIPVYYLNSPWFIHRNKFLREEFLRDIKLIIDDEKPQRPPWNESAKLVENEADALEAARQLRAAKSFSYDVETVGRQFDDDFRVIALAAVPASTSSPWVWDIDALANPRIRQPLLDALADPDVGVSGQYVKYDNISIRCAFGTEVRNIRHDTRLSRKLVYPEADASLGTMAHLVGMGGHKSEADEAIKAGLKEVQRKLRSKKDEVREQRLLPDMDPAIESLIRLGEDPKKYMYSFMPKPVLLRYVARDAVATDRIVQYNEREITEHNPELQYAWDTVLQPVSEALDQVESWGMAVSMNAIQNVSAYCQVKIAEIDKRLAPYGVNPNSTKQLRELLFDKLKLPVIKKTPKGEPSTDKSVMDTLAKHHPAVQDILDYRKYSKLDGTYATGLQQHIRADGRIHPNLKPDGTRSGRWSCTQPNLQNLPSEKAYEGKVLRECFVAEPGKILIAADYSQIELRVAAMLSGDEKMREIYASGDDFHMRTAQMVSQMAWGVDPATLLDANGKPTKDGAAYRRSAKAINFGLLYGQGDDMLAASLGIDVEQAYKLRRAILGTFSKLDKWIQSCLKEAHRTGYTWTYWNGKRCRRRPLFDIVDQDRGKQGTAERASWNTPIQGSAGEYNNMSIIELVNWVKQDLIPAKVIMAVHDCVLLECDEDAVDEVVEGTERIMTQWESHGVPLVVDVEVGRSWGDMTNDRSKWSSL